MANDEEKPMNRAEYERNRERWGLSQNAMARFVGVDERTNRRWLERDEVPAPVARWLRYMVGAKVTPDEVEAVLKRGKR